MAYDSLCIIYGDLCRAGERDPAKLFMEAVRGNLDANHELYCRNLRVNYDYLLSRSTVKVLRNIKKEEAREKRNGKGK